INHHVFNGFFGVLYHKKNRNKNGNNDGYEVNGYFHVHGVNPYKLIVRGSLKVFSNHRKLCAFDFFAGRKQLTSSLEG
ncbi:unnamed protein product, partial [marine sediment metagenome]